MRARRILALVVVALAGCGSAEPSDVTTATPEPTISPDGGAVPDGDTDGGADDGSGSPEPDRSADPDVVDAENATDPQGLADGLPFGESDVPAIVTTTGVPVAVTAVVPEGLAVRTPCGRIEVIPAGGEPLTDIDVVLDPGHGGPIDTGAVGPNGLQEQHLNLRLAAVTRDELERAGISVALTRTGGYATTLAVRSQFADALGAAAMVSIHHNAPTHDPSPGPGSEVFVQSGSDESRRLGGLVYAETVDALREFDDVAWTAAPDAGVLVVLNDEGLDAYGMMRRPKTPTALVELAYISNGPEAELLATAEYVDAAGKALARALERYLASPDDEGRGFQPVRTFNPERAPGEAECVDPALTG